MRTSKQLSRHVGILVETEDSWGRNVVEAICRCAPANGWSLLISPRDRYGKLRLPKAWQGHGVIAAFRDRSLMQHVRKFHIPVVDVSSASQREKWFARIQTDDAARAQLAVVHLRERGLQNFACYSPSIGRYSDQRALEYANCVANAGFHCETYESIAGRQWLTNHREVYKWLKKLPKPVGIFAGDPFPARQLIEVCMMNSIRIPDDVAIVSGDDDDLLCHIASPQISSIELASHQIGESAAILLQQLMNGATVPSNPTLIPPIGIRARQSTDTFAVNDDDLILALRFIRDHATKGTSVSEVAKTCHVSRRTLEQKFRIHLKCSPGETIRKARLEHVSRLLLDTDKSVTTIALQSGFASIASLCQAFQKQYGQTPGQFRQNGK